jgi:hypothetical protein
VPRPTADELSIATSGADGRLALERTVRLLLDDTMPPPPGSPVLPDGFGFSPGSAELTFPPFGSPAPPEADYRRIAVQADGRIALEHSNHARSWRLARRLRREATGPYDYALRVLDHLEQGYSYSERPPLPPRGVAPLDHFLFDSRAGYCQQFSGAMTLLLRMGGVPARVATGFSPGGYSKKREAWIVRDTDAHSWVEVWFDGYGWVAFDPTPPATPARSQIGAIRDAAPGEQQGDAGAGPGGGPGADAGDPSRSPGLRGEYFSNPAPSGGSAGEDSLEGGSGIPAWLRWAALAAILALAPTAVLRWRAARRRRGVSPLELAIGELERALRLTGRPAATGTTLRQLERRLGDGEAAGYIRALRTSRYGPAGEQPTRAQRGALRRELAAGAGWRGRVRSLWALPPRRARR